MSCSICEAVIPEGEVYYVKRVSDNSLVDLVEGVEHNGIVCQECYEEANTCEGCNSRFVEDDGRTDSDGDFWCDSCYDNHFSTCSYCSREVWMDDTSYDDGYLCDSCSNEHYFFCSCCDEHTHNDAGFDTVDGLVCSSCHDSNYRHCTSCCDTVHNENWCHGCDHCERCCTCDTAEDLRDADENSVCGEVPECGTPIYYDRANRTQPYSSVYGGSPEPPRAYPDNQNCSPDEPVPTAPSPRYCNESARAEPIIERPLGSTGMPALIQTLDNSAFTLNDTNIKAVLGMLDKSKKLKVGDITGRHCTANDSYFQLSRIVAEVGKIKKPRYFYGVRSNEYDIVLNHSTRAVVDKLNSLGLT